MVQATDKDLRGTRRLMAALGRMPPKPHSEMKLGKPIEKKKKSPIKRKSK
jgi:hypothetical protein